MNNTRLRIDLVFRAILLIVMSAAPAGILRAQSALWEPTGGSPERAYIQGLATGPAGALYAWSTVAGVYSMDRETGAWRHVALNIAPMFLRAGADGTLYSGNDTGLFSSTDGGVSWQRLIASNTTMLVQAPNRDLFAVADWLLYRSGNGGSTWEAISQIGLSNPQQIDVGPDGDLYVLTNGSLLRSPDRGTTWISIDVTDIDGSFAIDSSGALFAPVKDRGVLRSTDHGATWSVATTQPLFNITCWPGNRLLAFSANDTRAGMPALMLSSDRGETWRRIYRNWVNNAVIDGAGRIYLSRAAAVAVSADEGATWQEGSAGLDYPFATALASGPAGEVYATAFTTLLYGSPAVFSVSALYRTTDDGESWTFLRDSLLNVFTVDSAGSIFAACVGMEQPGNGSDTLATIVRSTDGGSTWSNGPTLRGALASIHSDGKGLVIVLVHPEIDGPINVRGIYRSTDNGTTWSSPDLPAPLHSLQMSPDGALYLIQGSPEETHVRDLLRSTDRGATWTTILEEEVSAMTVLPDSSLLAHTIEKTSSDYRRSTDRGTTWRTVSGGLAPPGPMLLVNGPGGSVYAAGDGVWRSTNRGSSWMPGASIQARQVSFDSRGWIYVLDARDSLHRSTDAGVSWTTISDDLPWGLIARGPAGSIVESGSGNLFVAGLEAVIYRSTTAGISTVGRERPTPPANAALSIHPNPCSSETRMRISLEHPAHIRVAVVDLLGREIAVARDGMFEVGSHEIVVDTSSLPDGLYLCRTSGEVNGSVPFVKARR